jgi:hypothetical protein
MLIERTSDIGNMETPTDQGIHWAVASGSESWRGCEIQRCIRAQLKQGCSPRSIMATAPSTSTPHSNFETIFNTALETYKRKTKKDLTSHPLLPSLQSCNSAEAIITVLRDQVPVSNQSRNGDDRLVRWVAPTVNVMYAFSATMGQGVLVNIT